MATKQQQLTPGERALLQPAVALHVEAERRVKDMLAVLCKAYGIDPARVHVDLDAGTLSERPEDGQPV